MSNFKTTDKIMPAVVFIVSFILFFITKIPTIYWWDSGLTISASYTLGVSSSPGIPVFVLLGRIFSIIPFLSEIALRVNLIIIISGALTATFVYLIITHILKKFIKDISTIDGKFLVYSSGIIGSLALTFSYSFWRHSLYTQIYIFTLLITAILIYLILCWIDTNDTHRRKVLILLFSFLISLDFGILRYSILLIPAILLMVYLYERELFKDYYLWLGAFIILVLGFSIHLTILVRSQMNPPVNFTAPDTLSRLWYLVSGQQYYKGGLFTRLFTRNTAFWNVQFKEVFLRYFGWQFIGRGEGIELFSLKGLYGIPFFTGIIGLLYYLYKNFKHFIILFVYFFTATVILVFYKNLRFPLIRNLDYLFLGSYLIFAVWIGVGVFFILKMMILLTKNRGFLKDLVYSVFTIGFLLLIPGTMFRLNIQDNNLSNMYIAEDYGYNALSSCKKDAVLFTHGDNDTVPLWYNQIVKGIREDVTIVNLNLLNAPWYILQLKNGEKKLPVDLEDEEINQISFISWERRTTTLDVPSGINILDDTSYVEEKEIPEKISFTVEPTIGANFLRVQDYILLNILNTNKWEKPLYFSVTLPDNYLIGLKPFLRVDGFAYKLIPFKDASVNPDILENNLIKTYRYRQLKDESLRHCEATESMIPNYRFSWVQLLDFYSKSNNEVKISIILDTMSQILPQRLLR